MFLLVSGDFKSTKFQNFLGTGPQDKLDPSALVELNVLSAS